MAAACARAFRLHPRAGIPGPDQGETFHARRAAPGRECRARSFRSLAGRTSAGSRHAAGLRHRSGRRAAEAQAGEGNLAQICHAQTASARQARRLHARQPERHGDFSRRRRFRRRLGQAGARPRHPGRAAAARKDSQCRKRGVGQAASKIRNWPIWCRRSAAARARDTATKICATSALSS